jgi:hypothetical protein
VNASRSSVASRSIVSTLTDLPAEHAGDHAELFADHGVGAVAVPDLGGGAGRAAPRHSRRPGAGPFGGCPSCCARKCSAEHVAGRVMWSRSAVPRRTCGHRSDLLVLGHITLALGDRVLQDPGAVDDQASGRGVFVVGSRSQPPASSLNQSQKRQDRGPQSASRSPGLQDPRNSCRPPGVGIRIRTSRRPFRWEVRSPRTHRPDS